jgi:hypothetical protein
MSDKNLFKYSTIGSLVLICLLLIDGAQCQFFTKSSKSIPRMGRRSLPEYQNPLEAYQQLLADEYNESLMNNRIESGDSLATSGGGEGWLSSAGNNRLADLIRSRERVPTEDYAPKMSRDERSGGGGAFYASG